MSGCRFPASEGLQMRTSSGYRLVQTKSICRTQSWENKEICAWDPWDTFPTISFFFVFVLYPLPVIKWFWDYKLTEFSKQGNTDGD